MLDFIVVLDRAHEGPVVNPHEWDSKVVPGILKRKLEEHGLKGTYDPSNPVNTDDGLADNFFKAAFEIASEVGVLCLDTSRVIKLSEDEIRDGYIYGLKQEIDWGIPPDNVIIRRRRPDDRTHAVLQTGPLGCPISEDLFVPIHQSVAQYRAVDALIDGTLDEFYGRRVKAKTPYETLVGIREYVLIKEALRRAGRPGLGTTVPQSGATEYGPLGAYALSFPPRQNLPWVLPTTEWKTSYTTLHSVAIFKAAGGWPVTAQWSMIGGYAGGPEGAALAGIVAGMMHAPIHQSSLCSGLIYDLREMGNSGRKATWASSIQQQAESRHQSGATMGCFSTQAGPLTEMLLYECIVGALEAVTSGCGFNLGLRSGGSRYKNHHTGLEDKFLAEVNAAASNMKRSDANEIIKKILPKYEEKLKEPPKGKSFIECFDIRTLEPNKEWLEIYYKIRKEAIDLGIPLE
jgi:methylamine--corrinoid protein Co-methyltransferase